MPAYPDPKDLLLERQDDWLTIWLNRPDVRNALSNPMLEELLRTLDAIAEDPGLRGLTFRGSGGTFCAGGDLKGFRAMFHGEAGSHAAVAATSRLVGDLFRRIEAMPQVVVMLVEGAAMAGGFGMVCAGDVVAVTRDAKFALTETTIGIPAAQIAPLVVRRMGLKTARRLMLTAARFDGSEAEALGLADFVAEDAAGLAAIEADIRRGVRRCGRTANAVTKEIVLATTRLEGQEMIDFAAEGFARCMITDEAREGIGAFLEKRKPSWAEGQ